MEVPIALTQKVHSTRNFHTRSATRDKSLLGGWEHIPTNVASTWETHPFPSPTTVFRQDVSQICNYNWSTRPVQRLGPKLTEKRTPSGLPQHNHMYTLFGAETIILRRYRGAISKRIKCLFVAVRHVSAEMIFLSKDFSNDEQTSGSQSSVFQ